MTFGSVFGRTFSPTFQPKSQAAAVAGGGWWNLNGTITSCVAAYQPKGAASYAASKVNLANPGTYDCTDGANYPSWDTSVGWTSNAANKYLDTGILVLKSYSVIVRYAAISGGERIFSGGGPGNYFIWRYYASSYGVADWGNGSSDLTWAPSWSAGIAALCGNGSDGFKVYTGGTLRKSITGKTFSNPSVTLKIFNSSGAALGNVLALAVYNADISASVADLTTAMAAL